MFGLLASVLLFLWAMQSGQFSDQARARYLPLVGETVHADHKRPVPKERYALIVISIGAACALAATFIVAVMNG